MRPKTGVAPAQHGVLAAAKSVFLLQVNFSCCGTCSIAKVNARVTGKVICVFHVPVTFLGQIWETGKRLTQM